MLTAKTMTSSSENHNAQRIVIIPFRFRVSPPSKASSCSKRRAKHPGGRPPADRHPYTSATGTSLSGRIRFHGGRHGDA
jgi:hypothetical protein